jgi:arginyl-tRNA synthetase
MMKTGCLRLDLEKTKDLFSVLCLKKILQVQILALLTQISDGLTDSLFYWDIPLVPTVTERDLTYRSAIAFKLRKKTSLEQEILAEQLFNALINQPITENINALKLEVQLIDRLWLTFILDCSSLQVWLLALSRQLNSEDYLKKRSTTIGITENAIAGYCQYAHARASNLLRLAEQEKILPFLPSTESVSIVELSPPMRSLLEQILRVIDQVEGKTPENWLKVSKNLSQSLLFFERHHRLFNPKNQSQNQLAWLLLINTRAILEILLLTKLQIPAPDEL